MSLGQWVDTVDGRGEIVEVSQSRFGSVNYRIVGDSGIGWYSAHQILSEIDEDHITTDINFNKSNEAEQYSSFAPEENTWLDGGTKLPYDPEPTEEFNGQITQFPGDHPKIDLTPTNSLKGHDTHPDPEDHNAIFEHTRHSSFHFGYDLDDEDWDDIEDEKDRQEGKNEEREDFKTSSVGPRQAFAEYLTLIDSNKLVREAAWADVRTKASRLYQENAVAVVNNDGREIHAKVDGDHGTYDVQVHRKNAFGNGITWYDCNCEWGKWAYKRERNFVGRLCSHGLATYYALRANKQPEKNVKKVNNTTERHSLASVPKFTPVETESIASQQVGLSRRNSGLMVWDDNLPKVMKEFFKDQTAPNMGADTAGPADATAGPDLSSQLASDTPADAGTNPVDGNFSGDNSPSNDPSQYVRTAEFSKNPDPDDNFEEWPDANSEDSETFNDTDKDFSDKDNDDEFGYYEHFWGRSSFVTEAGPFDQVQGAPVPPKPEGNPIPEPGRKLPHYIRKAVGAADRSETEGHSPEELKDIAERFNINGQPEVAQKFLDNRRKLQHEGDNKLFPDTINYDNPDEDSQPDGDFSEVDGSWQGIDKEYNDHEPYQSDHWLGEDEAEWTPRSSALEADEFDKSAAFQNEAEADAFNNSADDVVAQFQRSAAGASLFSDSDSGAFMTVASDPMSRTAGRNFTFSEQQELIDEPGVARHLGELNLDDTHYLD